MTTPQKKHNAFLGLSKQNLIFKRKEIFKYVKRAPARQSIRNWHKQFVGTGTLLLKSRSGWSKTSEKGIERIRQSFSRSPTKFIRTAFVRDT